MECTTRQAAYHSIVKPYTYRLPRSCLGAVPRLVSVPGATSDNGHYGNQVGPDRAGLMLMPIQGVM